MGETKMAKEQFRTSLELRFVSKPKLVQAPKSIALSFAPCLLEGMREVAVMKMMPNK